MLKSKGLPTAAWVYYIDHPVEHTQDLVMQLTADEIRANKVFRAVEKEGVQILELVSRNKRVAVKSGHSIGKTKTVCDLILWYMNTRVMATVVLTGAKFDQLKITTWAELGKWYECSTLRGDFEYTSERFFRKSHPKTWFTQIVTSLSPENIAGVHGEHVLVIVDEASAESVDRVRDPLLSLISRADNKLVLFGNPTRTEGMFFDAFHRDRDLWKTMTVNSEDSRIACSDPDFIASYKRRYHVDSDIYRVRIRGEFAKGNPKAVIALSDCESARNRVVVGGDFLEMAVDPAYEGNDLAGIGIRQGNKVLEIRVYPKCTPQELYRYVLKMVRDYRAKVKISSRIKIKVDMGGGFGSPLLESISLNREDNIEGVPINFGGKYDGEYRNYGTYMWFNLGTMIGQVQLPDDDDLIEELSSREWEPANMDKITIESKGKCKDRLGRSPDRADTCVMLFAGGGKKVFDIEIEQPSMVKEFEIDWRLKNLRNSDFSGVFPIESFNYAAIVINENLTLNGIVGIYQFIQNKLWVYEEFFQETPIAEYLALHVKRIILTDRKSVV